MLNLSYDAAQQRLRADLRELAAGKLRGHAREAEDAAAVPDVVCRELEAFGLPGADGFASGVEDPTSLCLAAETLAWADPGIAYAWLASRQVAWVIASCGTDEQKAKWLTRIGEAVFTPASLLMLEGRGLAPSEVETEIRIRGNGLVVNGYKSPVMYPGTALVSVIVGRDAEGNLTAVLAERLGDAVEFREGSGRLAMAACPTAIDARIRDLELPADATLKSDGLLRALTICRLAHASVCIGTAAAATRYAGEYAQKRLAFGKPIIAFQGVSFVLADLVMEADALQLSVLDLVTARDLPPEDLERQANAIIAQANQLVGDGAREGVQIMGVAGVTTDHPQERLYRSAAVLASMDFDPLNSELVLR
jgi:alkylation response protein AidB-like acyl-CoA dehydrogenase